MAEAASGVGTIEPAGGLRGFGRRAAWTCLAVLLVLAFVSYLDRQIVSLMVGMIKADLGVTDSQIGFLQGAAFGLVYPLCALPLGYAADRWSRRWVIFLAVVFWSIAAMAGGFATSFDTLLAARIGVGIGEAALVPAASSLLGDMFPRHRLGLVFSIYSSGSLLGSAGALIIGGAVIGWAGDGVTFPIIGHLAAWQTAFVVTGLPGALLAFLIFLTPEPPRKRVAGQAAGGHAPWSEVFAFIRLNPALLFCNIMGFSLLLLVTFSTLAWFPAILERHYGWSVAQVGATLGLFTAVVGLSGQLSNGLIVDRMMRRGRDDAHLRYYVLAAIPVTACGVIAPFMPNGYLYLVALVPFKFLLNFGEVSIASLQVVTPPRLRGRIAALTGMASAVVGGALGPSVVAFITDHIFGDEAMVPFSMAITIAIFVPLAGLCFAFGMRPMRRAVVRQRDAEAAAVPV